MKDFLTSTRLAETSDIIIRRYHISMTSAHTLAAQACLGILLHLDEDITRDCLHKFPLAEYAARHWLDHARFENVLTTVDHGMKRLFDPNKLHLATWLWMYDPTDLWHLNERGERPLHPRGISLHYAAICGFHTMVQHLIIEHSQDVNACGLHKMSTPLHWASSRGHVKVVRCLLEHGANVMAQCEDGSMPLHWASQKGRVTLIRVLLQHKADANSQDKNKSTPLHYASRVGYANSTRVLIEHGVDTTAQDKNGWTPLHCAAFEGNVEVTRVLLEHCVDTSVQDKDGRTPLHHASSEGNLEVTRVFLEHSVDATVQDNEGRTPLHRASFRGHVETVRLLLEQGADVAVQDKNGRTPLHHGSLAGHLEVARVLLEHGIDPTAKDKDGRTPSSSARRNGHFEIARIISRYESVVEAQTEDDVLSVWTKSDRESEAGVEERIGSRLGDLLSELVFYRNGMIPHQRVNDADSLVSSGSRTSTIWSLLTARTTLGRTSLRSKESRIISMRNGGSSNDTWTSSDSLATLNAGVSETVRMPHLHTGQTQVVSTRNDEDEKLNTEKGTTLSLSPSLVNSGDVPARPLDDTLSPEIQNISTHSFSGSGSAVHVRNTTPSPSAPVMTATQEWQPRPARRQVLRVDAQDGPWTVSVAENHPSSYTLYIKSECPFTKDLSDIFVPFLRPVVVSHSPLHFTLWARTLPGVLLLRFGSGAALPPPTQLGF